MKFIKLLLIGFLLSDAIPSYSEDILIGTIESSEGSKIDQLEKIVVTASRAETKLEAMPQHTTLITREDIEKSPAQSVDQLLRNIPGITLPGTSYQFKDPTGTSVTVRGMKSMSLVMVDGVPVMDPLFTTVQWAKIPMTTIERIEVIRGGTSSWGNMAAAGVINIITKASKKDDGTLKLTAGNLETGTALISKNLTVSDHLKINFALSGMTTDGFNAAYPKNRLNYNPGRGNSPADQQSFRLTGYFNPSEDFSAIFKIGYTRYYQDIGGYEYGNNLQETPDIQMSVTKLFDNNEKLTANLWAQYIEFNKQNGQGCYTNSSTDGSKCSSGTTLLTPTSSVYQYLTQADNIKTHEEGISASYSKDALNIRSSFQYGFDHRRIAMKDDLNIYSQASTGVDLNNPLSPSNLSGISRAKGTQVFSGLFGQWIYTPIDQIQITTSARYDYYTNIRANTSFTTLATNTTTVNNPDDSSRGTINPSISGRYDLNDSFAIRGSLYQAFKAPGLNNLYRSYLGSSNSVANPDLKPQKLVGREIGIDWKGKNYTLGATFFFNTIDSFIGTYTISKPTLAEFSSLPIPVQSICGSAWNTTNLGGNCGASTLYYSNGRDVLSRGLELDFKVDLKENLKFAGYYVHNDIYYSSEYGGPTDRTGIQLALAPQDVFGANLTWTPDSKWTLYGQARYSGRFANYMWKNNASSTINDWQGAYTIVDLNASYKFNQDINLFAAVNNIFDKQYSEGGQTKANTASYANFREMPRTGTVGLQINF